MMNIPVVFAILTSSRILQQSVPACDSEIFCQGNLLDAAQSAYIYNDSKSFVDMKLKNEPDVVLAEFQKLYNINDGHIPMEQMLQFVKNQFSPPGSEFGEWTPDDWTSSPNFLHKIADIDLRKWASNLNGLWKILGRKMVEDVKENPSLYSIIPVDNPVVVPGGRFREFYYWDSYWVIRGLLLCEMTSTVKGMLKNYLAVVEKYGFVPNGGRIYYERRSQPPMLIPMIYDYFSATGDKELLQNALPVIEKEYHFWMESRTVQFGSHTLNFYASDVNQPRPESYREDKKLIEQLSTEDGRALMKHITSACESGWDFSSRWAGTNFSTETNVLLQLRTRDIIPVDLNSILALNERYLAEFHDILGNISLASQYRAYYNRRAEAIESVLWNDEDGTYYDLVISTGQQNKRYFASNMNPLWTKCFPATVDVNSREKKMFSYMQNTGVLSYPGGIPTSLEGTGQQWDFPNAWPPLVHMIIEGLESSSDAVLHEEAFKQAQKWTRTNHKAYVETNAMFEKYDVTRSDGVPGSGGEYDVQIGFGWTNGVVLSFLHQYGSRITVGPTALPGNPETTTGAAATIFSPSFSLQGMLFLGLLFLFFSAF
ncbi:trehalase-like isoform X2 [Clavelina lepadiformis]|uniref:trehalase-like isoform X2 n=1 Tax=Clavelina lepadiformis TaxID=159417 RepID=UPI0040421A5F